ncbi:MAG: tRNA (adenosine(37)-N6)-threonylcarbamoyltransferase complex transferase subunit TsaD [Oscillospiraceae bacterium]|jgi:N6-L-threonylcarbamoyladenine synthase|nr:tRNA (adenosine(37)-N6)-threonylcarbamoyltransferase complex transferase subunit TsaD [Oscillospiraceae bacterium]
MRILAIESSCDETAAAVAANGRVVCSNVIASQIQTHREFGGVVPEIASRMHVEAVSRVVEEALRQAGLAPEDVDAVAVTHAPGLVGALLVGVNFAKGYAYALQKPLVAVHHLRSHVAANYLCSKDLKPPFLCLLVSGGHTQIAAVRDYTVFEVIGCTRDDAAGEALDKTARVLGLPYPGGVHLDKAGQGGNRSAFTFPRPKVEGKPFDFSFSGLKTAALHHLQKRPVCKDSKALCDFAASFQFAVADYLCGAVLRAAGEFGFDKVVLAGGVSANSVLREEMALRCGEAGLSLFFPEQALCGDNAAMVAAQGYYEFLAGCRAGWDLNAVPTLNISG